MKTVIDLFPETMQECYERSADRIAERSGACAAADDSLLRGRLSAVRVRRPAEGDVPGEHQAEDIA